MIRPMLAVLAGLLVLCACQSPRALLVEASAEPAGVASSDNSRRAAIRLQLATQYMVAGQYAVALDEVGQAIAADPSLVDAYHVRALTYMGMRDRNRADESFRVALSMRASDADILNNYGWFLCEGGRYAEGLPYLQRASAAVSPAGAVKPLTGQGVCQLRSGDAAAAEKSLQEALGYDRNNATANTNLALVYFHRADYRHAAQHLARVNGGQSASAQSLWLGARVAHKQGDYVGQAELVTRLRSRFPDSREMTAYEQGAWDE